MVEITKDHKSHIREELVSLILRVECSYFGNLGIHTNDILFPIQLLIKWVPWVTHNYPPDTQTFLGSVT